MNIPPDQLLKQCGFYQQLQDLLTKLETLKEIKASLQPAGKKKKHENIKSEPTINASIQNTKVNPRKRQKTNENDSVVKYENKEHFANLNFNLDHFTKTENVLQQSIKRRIRHISDKIETEEQVPFSKKNTLYSPVAYPSGTSSNILTDKLYKELTLIQRICMEIDLCLRLSSNLYPEALPFSVKSFNFLPQFNNGERRPFLSIKALNKLSILTKIPGLMTGDTIHVPFTKEEQLLVLRFVEPYIGKYFVKSTCALVRNLDQLEHLTEALHFVTKFLPGRNVNDSLKWVQSHINQQYYSFFPLQFTEEIRDLYEKQSIHHVYNPSPPPPKNINFAPTSSNLCQLLNSREIFTNKLYYETLIQKARYKSFRFQSSSTAASSHITDVKLDPSGSKQIVVGSTKPPNELLLFQLKTGKYKALEGHTDTVSRVYFSNDGSQLVSSSYDKSVRVWDAKEKTLVHTFKKQTVTELDEEGVEFEVQYPGHNAEVDTLTAGKDDLGHIYASCARDKSLYLWNILTREMVVNLSYRDNFGFDNWPGPLLELEFVGGQHSTWLVGGTDENKKHFGVVQVWDFLHSEILHIFHDSESYVSSLKVSKDGNLLVSADRKCRLHDLTSMETVCTYETLLRGNQDVNSVLFSPCGNYITCSCEDNCTLIFDLRMEKLLHILNHDRPNTRDPDNPQGVSTAQWLENSSMLISGGEDGAVRLWDISLAQPLVHVYAEHDSPISCLDISKHLFVSGEDKGKVNIYSTPSVYYKLC